MRFSLGGVLDREGWIEAVKGVIRLGIAILGTLLVSRLVGTFAAAAVFIVGLDVACRSFDRAVKGSIYRQRDGKLRELYITHKQYLDACFSVLYKDFETETSKVVSSFVFVEGAKQVVETVCAPAHVAFSVASVFKIPREKARNLTKSRSSCENCVRQGADSCPNEGTETCEMYSQRKD
ncbi:hypothetical protein FACS1894208_02260 [Clostridia bacterium]|nr:hypothetical protein FACS1894208_02260 [Clostridia bacterium]